MQDISSYSQYNPARSASYTFIITGRRDLSFKITNAPLSAVQLGGAPFPTRGLDIFVPSNKLAYDPMVLNFLLSEDLTEWIDVYQWMYELSHKSEQTFDTAELTVLNSQNVPVARFVYTGVWPLTLGDIQYTVVGEETVISCNLALQFEQFTVESFRTGVKITHGN